MLSIIKKLQGSSIDIGIDLGTTNTRVCVRDRGIVMDEPSVAAVSSDTTEVLAVGDEAQKILRRTPGNIRAMYLMKDGNRITEPYVLDAVLRHCIRSACPQGKAINPRVLVALHSNVASINANAIKETLIRVGASKVFVVEAMLAAAYGASLPVQENGTCMIVSIGGGTTEAAIIVNGSIIDGCCRAVTIGGDAMDEAIIGHMKCAHNLLIGKRTAEQIKIDIGSACKLDVELTCNVKGRDITDGSVKTVTVFSGEIREALMEPIIRIVEIVQETLGKSPPEFAAAAMVRGMVLVGGGSLLRGLDHLLAERTGMLVSVAKEPLTAVSAGAGIILQERGTGDSKKRL